MVLKSILVHTVYHKAVAQISQLLQIKPEKSLKTVFHNRGYLIMFNLKKN